MANNPDKNVPLDLNVINADKNTPGDSISNALIISNIVNPLDQKDDPIVTANKPDNKNEVEMNKSDKIDYTMRTLTKGDNENENVSSDSSSDSSTDSSQDADNPTWNAEIAQDIRKDKIRRKCKKLRKLNNKKAAKFINKNNERINSFKTVYKEFESHRKHCDRKNNKCTRRASVALLSMFYLYLFKCVYAS